MKKINANFKNTWILILAGVLFSSCNKDVDYSSTIQPYAGPEYYKLLVSARPDTLIVMPANSLELYADTSSQNPITQLTWRMISGPAEATIVRPNALRTTVTDLIAGTYFFELKVTDTQGEEAIDSVKIRVLRETNCSSAIIRDSLYWHLENGFGAYYYITVEDFYLYSEGLDPCRVGYINPATGDTTHVNPMDSTALNFPLYYTVNLSGQHCLYICDWPSDAVLQQRPKAVVFY